MTTLGAVLVAEVPTCTVLAAGVVAYYFRRQRETTDEHTEELTQLAQGSAVHEQRLHTVELLAASHDRRLPTISENLAIVAAFVERHERWHERAGDHPPG